MTDFKRHAERLRYLDARIGSPICLEAADAIDQLLALAKPEPGALSQRIKQSIEDGTFAVQSAKPASSPAGGDVVREALEKVRRWAESRCPCHNEEPNPCPLCGASVENLEACKSAENTLPRELLTTIRAALSQSTSGGRGE